MVGTGGIVVRFLSLSLSLILAFSAGAARGDSLNAPLLAVEFRATDTLRGVVGEHLGDSDLWPVVLRLNGIASPADLVPGAVLRLPVQQVRAADVALKASLEVIQKANSEGARIFAPVEIGQAIENRETAVLQREVGEWSEVVSFSSIATGFATEALEISKAQRDRAAEAVVSDVQGDVEGRAPAEPSWSDRSLHDILVEFERMRTLSNSTTQITFRDLSRLRLNANSNATIQRMRSDPLTGGEVTKVSLANGDFYALLNQLSDNTSFEIDVPGVKTMTESSDFWIKNDQNGARFVNYDTPDLEIQTGAGKIMVGENQGVVLAGQRAERTAVLTSVALVAPADDALLFNGAAELDWDAFDGAKAYWLEVARDIGFNQMQVSEWGIPDTGFVATGLPPGRYHWRVAALDQLGLPGEWSPRREFEMRTDNSPPYLAILSPATGSLVSAPQVELLAATEPDVTLTLNGQRVQPAADGSLLAQVSLVPGSNALELVSTDRAGNITSRRVEVVYRPSSSVQITLSDALPRAGDAYVTRSETISLSGTSDAGADTDLVVRTVDGDAILRARTGANGAFGFSVPAREERADYSMEILSPQGAVEGQVSFAVIRDQTPPELTLDVPPPRATGDELLLLEGRVTDATRLRLNGGDVALIEGRFTLDLELLPGPNPIELVAEDAVGNIRILTLQTVLDLDPPEILLADVSRPGGGGDRIDVRVEARDESGLRQVASYVIEVGGQEQAGFLRCDNSSGVCLASLAAQPGELELIEISVEDYAGNIAFY